MIETKAVTRVEGIDGRILTLRAQRVLMDADLAKLYGVTTGNLNKAVHRNLDRFPTSCFSLRLKRLRT